MNKFKDLVSEAPSRVLTFMTSPKFAAFLSVGVAAFQLAAAVDQMMASSKGKKQIGFTSQKSSPNASDILARAFGKDRD